MTAPVRQYVAIVVVGLVAMGAALGLLLLTRLVQPSVSRRPPGPGASSVGVRDHVGGVRRTLRVWCRSPTSRPGSWHTSKPPSADASRAGVSLAAGPAVADVVVTHADATLDDAERAAGLPALVVGAPG